MGQKTFDWDENRPNGDEHIWTTYEKLERMYEYFEVRFVEFERIYAHFEDKSCNCSKREGPPSPEGIIKYQDDRRALLKSFHREGEEVPTKEDS